MPTCHVFGDSFGVGQNISANDRYSKLVCDAKTWTESNHAVGATQIRDQADQVYGITVGATDKSLWITGINDNAYWGQDTNARADNLDAVLSMAAFMAIPSANKIAHGDGSITYGGSWTSTGELSGIHYHSGSPTNASFSISGTTIVIGTIRGITGTGSMEVRVDGSLVTTKSCVCQKASNTAASRAYQPALIIISGLSAGSHAVVLTPTSSAVVYLHWAAGLDGSDLGSRVYLGGTPLRVDPGYSMYSPFDQGSVAGADDYGTDRHTAGVALRAIGLGVYDGLVRPSLSNYQVDLAHPTEAGHIEMKDQFLSIIDPPAVAPTVTAASINAAGTVLSLTFSDSVTGVTASEYHLTSATLSAAEGSGTSWTMTITPVVYLGASPTLSYDGTGTVDSDAPLATFSGMAVTNNSTQVAAVASSSRLWSLDLDLSFGSALGSSAGSSQPAKTFTYFRPASSFRYKRPGGAFNYLRP